jgi:hypothetical protein
MKPATGATGFSFTAVATHCRPSQRREFSADRFQVRLVAARRPRAWCTPVNSSQAEGETMERDLVDHNKPVFDHLHSNIYAAAVSLVVWFALAAWLFFDRRFGRPSEVALQLTMVSVLFFVAVLLLWSLSQVWKRHRMPHDAHSPKTSFRDWRGGDFAVWGSKVHGKDAAIDMLLPFAAVAFGLTAIGIVFLIDASLAT